MSFESYDQLQSNSSSLNQVLSRLRNPNTGTLTQDCLKFSTGLFASGEPFDPEKLNLDNIFINLEDQLVPRLSG